jgi:hypothetical protein
MSILHPLESLRSLRDAHSIQVRQNYLHDIGNLKGVDFYAGDQCWPILIDDEYKDLRDNRQLMALFLVLRELEIYQSEPDFLKWCMQNGGDPADFRLLEYYRALGRAIYTIEKCIGSIDSRISSLDYELRTGIIRELVEAG